MEPGKTSHDSDRLPFEPETIPIPLGEFLMGSDPQKDSDAAGEEQPQQPLYLPDYHLSKTAVTNAQYAAFLEATGHRLLEFFEGRKPPVEKRDHPVVDVSWYDAVAYCQWLSSVTRKQYSLPSEAEWEKGARGTHGRIYPWGNQFEGFCNCEGEGTTIVGSYPRGVSLYSLLDMAGNVWEWTRSLWGKDWASPDYQYPYDPNDGREDLKAGEDVKRVVRGGSFTSREWMVRCAVRHREAPNISADSIGFRVMLLPS
jgi:formylglycine-generating enzyme required for sulfatase activity